jgi:hypothetical protein
MMAGFKKLPKRHQIKLAFYVCMEHRTLFMSIAYMDLECVFGREKTHKINAARDVLGGARRVNKEHLARLSLCRS